MSRKYENWITLSTLLISLFSGVKIIKKLKNNKSTGKWKQKGNNPTAFYPKRGTPKLYIFSMIDFSINYSSIEFVRDKMQLSYKLE